MGFLRVLAAFAAAVLATHVLGAVLQTQFVLQALAALPGVDISLGERLAMTARDVVGLLGSYLPIVAIALLVAFLVAAAVLRWLMPGLPVIGYTLAGAVALATVIVTMETLFGFMPIGGARSLPGQVAQVVAGGVGGFLFAWLRGLRPGMQAY